MNKRKRTTKMLKKTKLPLGTWRVKWTSSKKAEGDEQRARERERERYKKDVFHSFSVLPFFLMLNYKLLQWLLVVYDPQPQGFLMGV